MQGSVIWLLEKSNFLHMQKLKILRKVYTKLKLLMGKQGFIQAL